MTKKFFIVPLVGVGLSLGLAACNPTVSTMDASPIPVSDMEASPSPTMMASGSPTSMMGVEVGGSVMSPDKTLAENAMNSNDHTTLVAALKAAGMSETLMGAGPFTVFAPSNAAFSKLPAGTVDSLLMPENKAKLSAVLKYHVVAGRYKAADLKDGMKLKTVQGETIMVSNKAGVLMLNGATVLAADVVSSNGVLFSVDTVLMPPTMVK